MPNAKYDIAEKGGPYSLKGSVPINFYSGGDNTIFGIDFSRFVTVIDANKQISRKKTLQLHQRNANYFFPIYFLCLLRANVYKSRIWEIL